MLFKNNMTTYLDLYLFSQYHDKNTLFPSWKFLALGSKLDGNAAEMVGSHSRDFTQSRQWSVGIPRERTHSLLSEISKVFPTWREIQGKKMTLQYNNCQNRDVDSETMLQNNRDSRVRKDHSLLGFVGSTTSLIIAKSSSSSPQHSTTKIGEKVNWEPLKQWYF